MRQHKPKIKIKCAECENEFRAWSCQKRKFCSLRCFRKNWKKRDLSWLHTKDVHMKISKTISGRKRPEITGDKNYKWKGGISRGYKTGYYSLEYRIWREDVFKRDNYTCQGCLGERGQYITAHHIKSFAHFPELRFVLDNGITLCEKCHTETDNYKGRGRKILSANCWK